jgi:hypothetical protein
MIFSVPPLVKLIPALFPFGIQIPPPVVGVMAVFAALLDRPVQFGFGFFDRMLALPPVIGARLRCRHEQQKCSRRRHCHYGLSESSIQVFLLSVSLAATAGEHQRGNSVFSEASPRRTEQIL